MQIKTSNDSCDNLLCTHFFIYNEKKYPFNMFLFRCFSNYFNSNENQCEENRYINLQNKSDDYIKYSESAIKDFINYCHNHQIDLSKDNVPTLYNLAKKFKVPSLLTITEKYINDNGKEFVVDFLKMKQENKNFEIKEYEEMIAKDLADYIKDNQLLSLSISVLYNILKIYSSKKDTNNYNISKKSEEQLRVIDFLFRCLDHFGRDASVLFENIDFGNLCMDVFQKLFKEYSDIFDFHFINSNNIKRMYEFEIQLYVSTEKIKENQNQMIKEIKQNKIEQNEKIEKNEKQQQEFIKEIKSIHDENLVMKKEIEQLKSKQKETEEYNERQRKEFLKTIDLI